MKNLVNLVLGVVGTLAGTFISTVFIIVFIGIPVLAVFSIPALIVALLIKVIINI